MVITPENITKAISDMPVQPLFNTIGEVCRNAGIGLIVTNTEALLNVTCSVTIGSVAAGTALTDEDFEDAISTLSVSGFKIESNIYFSLMDLDAVLSTIPNEFRTSAAGLSAEATVTILKSIGLGISEKLQSDIYSNLQALTVGAGVPAAHITAEQAGLIQWNTLADLTTGQAYVYTYLDNIITALPLTMQPGGSAGDKVVAWVNSNDFATLKNSITQSYQNTPNGGFTSNYFEYVKSADTVSETRAKVWSEFIRYKNIIVKPLNGMLADTILCTYQECIASEAPVFTNTIPSTEKNNLYFCVKGAFEDNIDFISPVAEAAQAISDLPYQVGSALAINKSENKQSGFKVISTLGFGVAFREADKVFAVFPAK